MKQPREFLEQAAALTRLARIDERGVLARLTGLELLPICSRCGGGGQYSFNHRDGTRCWGCGGSGQRAPKTDQERDLALEGAREAALDGRLDDYLQKIEARTRARAIGKRMFELWGSVGCDYVHHRVKQPGYSTDTVHCAINRPVALARESAQAALNRAEANRDLGLWIEADRAVVAFERAISLAKDKMREFEA